MKISAHGIKNIVDKKDLKNENVSEKNLGSKR
jgi:hypothetical protein